MSDMGTGNAEGVCAQGTGPNICCNSQVSNLVITKLSCISTIQFMRRPSFNSFIHSKLNSL